MTDPCRVRGDEIEPAFGPTGEVFDVIFIALTILRSRLTGLGPRSNGKPHLHLHDAANGKCAVSGMLLIIKRFVRRNPDKKTSCDTHRGREAG